MRRGFVLQCSLVVVAAVYSELRNLPISVGFPRILVPLSIVYSLRKFDALTPFRSVVTALGTRQVPGKYRYSCRGITRKRNTGITKLFTESRKREFPFSMVTLAAHQWIRMHSCSEQWLLRALLGHPMLPQLSTASSNWRRETRLHL